MTLSSVSRSEAYRHALANVGYEVLPFKGTLEQVVAHVPTAIPITVTVSPQKGIDATVKLTVDLTAHDYDAVPHLSARLVKSHTHLKDVLAELDECRVESLFVIGGDGEPLGPYADALALLRKIREFGYEFRDIGIGGYPDGHADIPDDVLLRALTEKAEFARYITTQICFDARKIRSWFDVLQRHGVTLPVHVGVPGAVSRQKLLRVSTAIGIRDSARFLHKQQALLWRFITPGGFNPRGLMRKLAPTGVSPVARFHLFTFNDLRSTEEWRQRELARSFRA